MKFFNDLTIIGGDRYPDLRERVERRINECFAINFLAHGEIVFGQDRNQLITLKAPAAYWTKPGPTYYYWKIGTKRWDHYWVGFLGERVNRYLHEELLTDFDPGWVAINDSRSFKSDMERCISTHNKDTPWEHAQKCQAIERLLVAIQYNLRESQVESDLKSKLIESAHRIEQYAHDVWDFEKEADRLGISYSYYRRLFKQYHLESPHNYLLTVRMQKIAAEIKEQKESIKTVAYKYGYENLAYFSRLFKRHMGVSPRNYVEIIPNAHVT